MKVFLMFPQQDFDLKARSMLDRSALTQDLELALVWTAMGREDPFVQEVAQAALLAQPLRPDVIRYRQDVLRDCMAQRKAIRDLYALAVEAIDRERRNYWGIFREYPTAVLRRSIGVLEMFVEVLARLRAMAGVQVHHFQSAGFGRFWRMCLDEITDPYLAQIKEHLALLKFPGGVDIVARLGDGNRSVGYTLQKPAKRSRTWWRRFFSWSSSPNVVTIADRDESGLRALSELNDRGLNRVANALAQSNDHVLSFFKSLRLELAFYIGALNLQEQLARQSAPVCVGEAVDVDAQALGFTGLYDIALALRIGHGVVANSLDANGRRLLIVTGANQGGKSTFLRSLGQAQLMLGCGLFVPALAYRASAATNILTHFRREEDATLTSGKLDEELARMSSLVPRISPGTWVLFNESFSATNEREGSDIARQVIRALTDRGVRVAFVTHLHDFARSMAQSLDAQVLALRAGRNPDGTRTFEILPGEPLPTSFGPDLYTRVFGADDQAEASGQSSAVTQ